MALMKFGFALERDPDLDHVSRAIKGIESVVRSDVSTRFYGTGVKHIAVGVILVERFGKQFVRNPVYKAGKYESRISGIRLQFEDTLEFDIRPSMEAVRSAKTVGQIAECLRRALAPARESLLVLKIPNFDMRSFLFDFDEAFTRIALVSANEEIVNIVQSRSGSEQLERSPAPGSNSDIGNVPTDRQTRSGAQPQADDFPAEVLAFVERELPNVEQAVELKDRKLLEPMLTRSREFLEWWNLHDASVFERYQACAFLMADVVREGAVELSGTDDGERARVHEQFQKNWDGCKAAQQGRVEISPSREE